MIGPPSRLAARDYLCGQSVRSLIDSSTQIRTVRRTQSSIRRYRTYARAAQSTADVDFPPYSILNKGSEYDLRLYDVYKVVRMPYERRDEGYIGLGAYFDGQNDGGLRLRQSQPVVMRFTPMGPKTMELCVASGLDGKPVDVAPQPLDRRLSIEAAGGEIAAVLRFQGSATREATESAMSTLRAALAQDGLVEGEEEGAFRLAQYGPLNSLSTRLNEVLLRVKI